jgi:hypothetical protein
VLLPGDIILPQQYEYNATAFSQASRGGAEPPNFS